MSNSDGQPRSPISWGIIGCGDVTEVKSGPAFNKVPGSSLVAVMRRDDPFGLSPHRGFPIKMQTLTGGRMLQD